MDGHSRVMDRAVEPEGYRPPTSAEELCARYLEGERYFERSRVIGESMLGTNLEGANLRSSTFNSSILDGANLAGTDLTDVRFYKASLVRAVLKGARMAFIYLSDADLSEADASDTDLSRARMSNTNLHLANLDGATLRFASVTPETYVRSQWSAEFLLELHRRGLQIRDLERFPSEVRSQLLGEDDGLTLYFSTRLSFFDRFLVEGVIFSVLGRDTRCHVVEFRELENENVIVRLNGSAREELEAVATALWNRVWEVEEQTTSRALSVAVSNFQIDLRRGLSDLADKLYCVENRLPSDIAKERIEALGQHYVMDADRRQFVRTWGQKILMVLGKRAVGVVAKGVEKELFDAAADSVGVRAEDAD